MDFHKKRPGLSLLDGILGLLIIGMGIYVGYRIHTRFDYQWNWDAVWPYFFRYDEQTQRWVPNLIMQGFFTTIRLSVWSTVLALPMGSVMGLLRNSNRLFNRLIGGTYVSLVRNLPPLVLIYIFYFFISEQLFPLLELDNLVRSLSNPWQSVVAVFWAPASLINAFVSGTLALALLEGAYITEIIRAGIQSVDKGQWEAASALGMSAYARMRYVILPQAVKNILPPLAGQFISTIKDSAIVSVISIQELTFQGMELMAATYLTFEIWIVITLMYLVLALTCSLLAGIVEKRLQTNRNSAPRK